MAALGNITVGGIVEGIQHIGATAVPGLESRPYIDIALAVWPFPLQPQHSLALEGWGYELVDGYAAAPEQRLQHTSRPFCLYVVEPGSDRWYDYLNLRDYLRHDEHMHRAYSAAKRKWIASGFKQEKYDANKAKLFAFMLAKAHQWWIGHNGFKPVEAVAQELQGFSHPWYISSGWALDLFLGHVGRVHHDVDVVIARADQLDLQQYMTSRGWKFVTPLHGQLGPWPPHMRLELPRHQAHAHRGDDFVDFLFTDIENGVWRYRREPSIVQTVERIAMRSIAGIPFLAPEIALLFKRRNYSINQDRSKDQNDFERV
jgi:GrpB-like predicted nucleotidyltransferase (UPF0157 family)